MKLAVYLDSSGKAKKSEVALIFAEGAGRWDEVQIVRGRTPVVCDVAAAFMRPAAIAYDKYRFDQWMTDNNERCVAICEGLLSENTDDPWRHLDKWAWGPRGRFHVGYYRYRRPLDSRRAGVPRDRWDALGYELAPWKRNDDGHIVVCGLTAHDHLNVETDIETWGAEVCAGIKRLSDREIVFRAHPRAPETPVVDGVTMSGYPTPLAEDLENAWCLVTLAGTSAVEALIAGVPVIALSEWCASYPAAGHFLADIEKPPMLPRRAWANGIGYAQWTVDEIREGLAWGHLRQGML